MIQSQRIEPLNRRAADSGDFVIYWMQASQRAQTNFALEFAIEQANTYRVGLFVFFALVDDFPQANLRHYHFMLQGLKETQRHLLRRGIPLIVQNESPLTALPVLARRAKLVVTDCGYLQIQKAWRRKLASRIDCPLIQVESDVIVPVAQASGKEEYAAATLRPKIHRQLEAYLRPLRDRTLKFKCPPLDFPHFDISDTDSALARLKLESSVGPSPRFVGGYGQAQHLLHTFIAHKLDRYDQEHNNLACDVSSHLSPYLHFGQIAPLEIALAVKQSDSPGKEAFLEQLIVRRELAINFVHYNANYHRFQCLPVWARANLKAHAADRRPYRYSLAQLEAAQTHDLYWNAGQMEMVLTGAMHNYMRMYWGKKIIEWTASPMRAYQIALYLNNKYELDGRDANGYAGVAWCFGKHDRPWATRSVFGSVRYMNDAGLKRKANPAPYVQAIQALQRQ